MRSRHPRFAPVLAILFVLLVTTGTGDAAAPLTIDADAQYRYARTLIDRGDHDAAIAEFDRFVHFFPDDPRVPQARFSTAMSHFKADRIEAAAGIFLRITDNYAGDPLQTEAFFMLSRCHARQGKSEQAMLDLHNLMVLSDDTAVIDRARYAIGWLYVDQARWEQAATTFDSVTAGNRHRLGIPDLQQALARSDAIAHRDPTTAGLLSIVPGGGQLYCGRYKDALAALLINTGLIWASWEAFDNDQPALGSVLAFVEFGFYAGNIYGATASAHKFNREQAAMFREDLYRQRQPRLSLGPLPDGAALCLTVKF